MAHLALTDVDAGRFHARERWARGRARPGRRHGRPGPGVARRLDGRGLGRRTGCRMRLRAGDGDLRIDLTLAAGKPPVLHGERGLSPEERRAGERVLLLLAHADARSGRGARGRAARSRSTGLAWMDREWSTSALGPELVGWDWFALQLDDGRELMLYRLRRRDGGDRPGEPGDPRRGGRRDARASSGTRSRCWPSTTGRAREAGTRYPAAGGSASPSREPRADRDTAPRGSGARPRRCATGKGRCAWRGPRTGARSEAPGYVELVGYAARREGGGEAVRQ